MNQAKKKYQESKKSLLKENTELWIENEVIKRQLISIRNMINNILGDDYTQEIEKLRQKELKECHVESEFKQTDDNQSSN